MWRIDKVLVANRGEIARRILRTCRELGIATVAVYSEADRQLPFVLEADEAVLLGPAPSESSYLAASKVIEAAKRTGAQAIHPGYGFLAENADFAQAVHDAGLVWIGPPPAAMRALGDKAAARKLAQQHGVPVVPGYDGVDQSEKAFVQAAESIGYPLLVKAAAGGGGRGMRRVDRPGDLPEALESARREARAAFGDGTLLLERVVPSPRHVEVQVLADVHGRVIHLHERECSVQRRHQKVLEEAPSPAVDAALRQRLGSAAIQVARAAGYASAGTAEFLLDENGLFYFLEMNTRLQVEHPVTELITGLDLVALQIAIAEGHDLPLSQDEVPLRGHAIEARLYAEDPNREWMPSTGRLLRLELPTGEGVRVDAGYRSGDEVGVHYDAMLAKIIAWGPDRRAANRRLHRALRATWAPGLTTNLPLLREVVDHEAWSEGALHTGFLAAHGLPRLPPLNLERGALAATVHGWWHRRQSAAWPGVPAGFRLDGEGGASDRWRSADAEVEVAWRPWGEGLQVKVGEGDWQQVRVLAADGDRLTVEVDGHASAFRVHRRLPPGAGAHDDVRDGDVLYVHLGDAEAVVSLVPRFPVALREAEPGTCSAPTPGTVAAVLVAPSDTVEQGQVLVVLEAMKMEHKVLASQAGTVAAVRVAPGDTVDQGALLVRIEEG